MHNSASALQVSFGARAHEHGLTRARHRIGARVRAWDRSGSALTSQRKCGAAAASQGTHAGKGQGSKVALTLRQLVGS